MVSPFTAKTEEKSGELFPIKFVCWLGVIPMKLFFSVAFWGDGTPLSQEISFITLELEMQGRKERIKILYKGQRKLKACNLKPLARSCGTSYFCWEGIPLVESG